MDPLQPKPTVPVFLDTAKPLFDEHGNLHQVVLCNAFQLLTTFRGYVFVWDRRSGESPMTQRSQSRLSNSRAPDVQSGVRPTSEDRRRMKQSTAIIDCLRQSSRAQVNGWKGFRRTDEENPS